MKKAPSLTPWWRDLSGQFRHQRNCAELSLCTPYGRPSRQEVTSSYSFSIRCWMTIANFLLQLTWLGFSLDLHTQFDRFVADWDQEHMEESAYVKLNIGYFLSETINVVVFAESVFDMTAQIFVRILNRLYDTRRPSQSQHAGRRSESRPLDYFCPTHPKAHRQTSSLTSQTDFITFWWTSHCPNSETCNLDYIFQLQHPKRPQDEWQVWQSSTFPPMRSPKTVTCCWTTWMRSSVIRKRSLLSTGRFSDITRLFSLAVPNLSSSIMKTKHGAGSLSTVISPVACPVFVKNVIILLETSVRVGSLGPVMHRHMLSWYLSRGQNQQSFAELDFIIHTCATSFFFFLKITYLSIQHDFHNLHIDDVSTWKVRCCEIITLDP